jgi:M-phase inducer tyrosine phosphatase
MMEMSEDESEFEASPSVEYARRTGSRVVPRVDGSPGFKPMRSSMAAVSIEASASPSGKCKKASPYGSGGLPRFGDNEMDGKILPCHKVKEDGLVRVAPETVGVDALV